MPTAKAKATVTPEEAAGAAQGWNPEPGSTLTGTVVQIEKIESQYGEYPMITLDTADGYVNLHAFHRVLLSGLMKIKPRPGDRLTVTYHGEAENKRDPERSYHNYTVRNPDKPVEAFDWNDDADF